MNPWNWCPKCNQEVDVGRGFDGKEVRCWGCKGWFVIVEMGDDLSSFWILEPLEIFTMHGQDGI